MNAERLRHMERSGIPALLALLGLALAGCDAPFLAVEPRPGDLQGQWMVNESPHIQLGPDCPVVAHLRVRNQLPRRVRMVSQVRPLIEQEPDLKWKAYRKLPGTLEPGASWEGVWLLTDTLETGAYAVGTGGALKQAPGWEPARVEVRGEKLPAPVRTQQHCVAARLTGEVDQVVDSLTGEIEAGLAPPSTHLQLAELLQSLGDQDGARGQYERFAERVYGNEELPGWLRSKLGAPASEPPP